MHATKTNAAGGESCGVDTPSNFQSDNTPHPLAGHAACPHFHKCNAPLCPLDPHWQKRRYVDGETLCHYMLELAKPSGVDKLKANPFGVFITATMQGITDVLITRYGGVRRRLQRASQSASRLGRRVPAKAVRV